jgi:3-phosphoshikimate 1-carboxyvinyltransferase
MDGRIDALIMGEDCDVGIESTVLDLTEEVLKAAGIVIGRPSAKRWSVRGGQRYAIAGGREVEGDWSQAAFFLAMGGVEVDGLNPRSLQGDRAVARLLDEPVVDASPVPDLVPALAARAAFRPGVTRFINCARLRIKESDRLESTAAMVNAVGGRAKIEGDVLEIEGVPSLHGGKVETMGDHRIAMAAAVISCGASGPVTVEDSGVVSKSYPGFWRDFNSLERLEP